MCGRTRIPKIRRATLAGRLPHFPLVNAGRSGHHHLTTNSSRRWSHGPEMERESHVPLAVTVGISDGRHIVVIAVIGAGARGVKLQKSSGSSAHAEIVPWTVPSCRTPHARDCFRPEDGRPRPVRTPHPRDSSTECVPPWLSQGRPRPYGNPVPVRPDEPASYFLPLRSDVRRLRGRGRHSRRYFHLYTAAPPPPCCNVAYRLCTPKFNIGVRSFLN